MKEVFLTALHVLRCALLLLLRLPFAACMLIAGPLADLTLWLEDGKAPRVTPSMLRDLFTFPKR